MSAVDDTTTLEMDDFLGIVANGLVAKKKNEIYIVWTIETDSIPFSFLVKLIYIYCANNVFVP